MKVKATKLIAVVLCLAMILSTTAVLTLAADKWDGYTAITDAAGLAAVESNLAGNYYLGSDITLSGDWEPIGWLEDSDAAFTGIFDGNGKTVTGLTTNYDSGSTYVGLFAINEGTIKNLTVSGAAISGGTGVGAIVGVNRGMVSDCNIIGSDVIGVAKSYNTTLRVGGITGQNASTGTVQNCNVTDVYVTGNRMVGGVAGSNLGTVDNCYITNIKINSRKTIDAIYKNGAANYINYNTYVWSYVGGVIGNNQGSVNECYVLGDIALYGFDYVGGLVGYNSGSVSTCWMGATTHDMPFYKAYNYSGYTFSPEAVKLGVATSESDATVTDVYTGDAHVLHNFGEYTVISEATCTQDGVKEHTCTECGVTVREVIPAAHTPGEWTEISVPSCVATGYKELRCTVCNTIIDSVTTAATGHTSSDWNVILEPTCLTTGTKEIRCTVCGELITSETIPALGHTAGEWTVSVAPTCVLEGTKEIRCTVCNELLESATVPAAGHTAGEWTILVPPTCVEAGTQEYRCTVCGELLGTDAAVATGHTAGEWTVVTDATCTADGVKEIRCTVCNELLASEAIPATGHVDSDNNGRCDICNAKVKKHYSNFFEYLKDLFVRFFEALFPAYRK